MASTTHSALRATALTALVALSLAGHAGVERALGFALTPLRAVSEVAAPLCWLRLGTARAAEGGIVERGEQDLERRAALEAAQERYTVPLDEALRAGRSFLQAETVGRPQGHWDGLLLRAATQGLARVEAGMPVVAGDFYVGRIERVDLERGVAVARLVTARDFRVGATIAGETGRERPRMVVGGVAESRAFARGEILLDVRHPSQGLAAGHWLVVDEEFSSIEPFREVARGFRLGRLEELTPPSLHAKFAAASTLDFRGGLFRLAIVAPAGTFDGDQMHMADVLLGEDWISARSLVRGDPHAARASFKLALGERNGARVGAAVVFGARLVGRVARAAPLCVDVALLGESGFCAPAMALIEGVAQPIELGRIVSLGWSDASGTRVRFLLDALPALAADDQGLGAAPIAARRATIFSGAGDPLVPMGLVLGETQLGATGLDAALGPATFELELNGDPRELSRAWVRVERAVHASAAAAARGATK